MDRTVTVDHIGVAVESLEKGAGVYGVIGLEVTDTEEVPGQGVRVAFLPAGEPRIELLEPTGPDSPIATHLERRGPGLHHVCFRVPDIRRSMDDLARQGYRLLSDEPQLGAHDCLVCFVHPKDAGGVLIELSQPVSGG